MRRLWPWSSGEPVETEHNELEERMGPDVQEESSAYEFQARNGKASRTQERPQSKNGRRQALQR